MSASIQQQVLYETDRLILRDLQRSDIEGSYYHWFNDQEVCRFSRHGTFPSTIDKVAAYIDSLQHTDREFVWAIVEKESEIHIGNIALQNINPKHRLAALSILIGDRNCWGKGYALEASKLLVEHGFLRLGLHRIACETSVNNEAMIKLAEALGMRREGICRQIIFENGEFADIVEFGLLKSEFET